MRNRTLDMLFLKQLEVLKTDSKKRLHTKTSPLSRELSFCYSYVCTYFINKIVPYLTMVIVITVE